ncbi:hypothetical protein QTO34_016838 [Cnephaeus nilssonii]|uniref:Core shell protein Gag P30 domain-containing protein n=1 Tax=Cnephaeus nilssonii TaxID=3371016 RepID=A0AA40I334_CNENI|nr:hypothetical protein QTO34_016838 [Eptesicus nilssonii]
MAKTSEVFQKPDESPAAFYERLCEPYWIYTPFDPKAPANQTMVNAAFADCPVPLMGRDLLAKMGAEITFAPDGSAQLRIGYRVSKRKAQISQREVKYLGFRITRGKQRLGTESKQAICAVPVPSTWQQIREFLGAAGFCQQNGKDSVLEGNRCADAAAKLAAKEQVALSQIMLSPELPEPPKYTPQEEEWA